MSETADLYNSGMTLAEIGRKFGISHVAVWKRLEKEGVERRPSARRSLPVADFALGVGDGTTSYRENDKMRWRCGHRGFKQVDWRALFPLSAEERRLVAECLDVDNLTFPDTIEVIEDHRKCR